MTARFITITKRRLRKILVLGLYSLLNALNIVINKLAFLIIQINSTNLTSALKPKLSLIYMVFYVVRWDRVNSNAFRRTL